MIRLAKCVTVALLVIGCSEDADTTAGPSSTSPAGGWSSGGGLYACFGADGKLGVGDQQSEAEEMSAGTWTAAGALTIQGTKGTWSLSGGTLTLGLDCTEQECGPFQYQRDASLACK